MILQWHGNACMRISCKGTNILFDPYVKIAGGDFQNRFEDLRGSNAIFVTHGHFDHVLAIPELLEHEDIPVYCTQTPAQTLARKTDKKKNIHVLEDGNVIQLPEIKVTILRGKHIRFTVFTVLSVLLNARVVRLRKNVLPILNLNRQFQEAGETVCYLIEAENRKILILGSLGLQRDKVYPKNIDLLVIPIQGKLRIWPLASKIIGQVCPKAVLFDHFDDAFPPVSLIIDIQKIAKTIGRHHPDLRLIIPEYNQKIEF